MAYNACQTLARSLVMRSSNSRYKACFFVLLLTLISVVLGSCGVGDEQTPTPTQNDDNTQPQGDDLDTETSGLSYTITIDPSEPSVGDAVRVTAFASGSGGIPRHTLQIEPSGY